MADKSEAQIRDEEPAAESGSKEPTLADAIIALMALSGRLDALEHRVDVLAETVRKLAGT